MTGVLWGMRSNFVSLAILLALAAPVRAQPPQPAPPPVATPDPNAEPGEDPEEQEHPVELPPPGTPVYAGDPRAYWTGANRALVRVDPLGDRRVRKNDPKVVVDNAVPPLLYRLWGLPPLQTMVLRPGEMVVEVWVRPTGASYEQIARLTVRRDGKVFIQARAGMGCCRPEIARRVDIDQVLEQPAAPFLALGRSPVWNQPPDVEVFRPNVVAPVCVKGAGYDLTLLQYDRAVHLRRICDSEAVGSVAAILSPVLGAAMGKDPRFDTLFRGGADFALERGLYDSLIAEGGQLRPKPFNR